MPEVNIKQTVTCPDVEVGEIPEKETDLGINSIFTFYLWPFGVPAFITADLLVRIMFV